MAARVQLIQQENIYYVLTFPTSNKDPRYKTCFPYLNKDQGKTLENARAFGNSIAESLGTKLNEKI